MEHVLAVFAACLLYAGSAGAAELACSNSWSTQKHIELPEIVLETGIGGFKVGQPAPPEVLEKIGPLLCAAGTEQLRVGNVNRSSPLADPARHAERAIRLEQFIHGRKVFLSTVNLRLNIETNEVLMINANFLPDRDLDHEPQLTAGQAKVKAAAGLSEALNKQLGSNDRRFAFSNGPAPQLAYEIEQSGFAPARGVLVWELSAANVETVERYQVHVDARTGRIVRAWAWAVN